MSDNEFQPPVIKDQFFSDWLMKQFRLACKKERRAKPHLDNDANARYIHHSAQRMKRCIREAFLCEEQADAYNAAVEKAGELLAGSMHRNEISPALYQTIMSTLKNTDIRRQ